MKKILKHKKIIVFILAFTLAFGVISDYKQKESQAVVLIDDVILWTLGALVLATGVVAISGNQVTSMGEMVVDRLKNLDQDLEYIRNGSIITGIKIGNSLTSAVNWVAENLPQSYKLKKEQEFNLTGTYPTFSVVVPTAPPEFSTIDNLIANSVYSFNINDLNNHRILPFIDGKFLDVAIDINPRIGSGSWISVHTVGTYYVSFYSLSSDLIAFTLVAPTIDESGNNIGYTLSRVRDISKSNWGKSMTLEIREGQLYYPTDIRNVDLSNEKIRQGYNPTYTNDNLVLQNEKEGYIPIPQSIPTDIPVSTEIPLNWDTVKEHVQPIPVDNTQEGTGELEIPNVDVPEGLNLWEWLKALLMAILKFLKAILDFLLNIVKTLIKALTDLLMLLFAPTKAISDLFPLPTSNGLGAIPSLLNFDSLWSITPKPIEFETDVIRSSVGLKENLFRNWNIVFKPFDVPFVKNNLFIIRNLLSYTMLIYVVWNILHHFMPKRDMD